ncbi:MAG TPA: aspartate kinase, partial [Gammaproteobacteria bacterium]|nr:aspartate kinase [Gammaproteobacteria bacterium]
MSLIVQKFGGTSVGTIERIQAVSKKLISFQQQGHQLVVVLSAMSGETNRLLELANQVIEYPSGRELDVLLSTGEQVTIALLCMALKEQGITAKSYTGSQIAIITDSHHNKARIQHIDTDKIRADLAKNCIVVVAGFQGRDEEHNITTLGRGGSDTTAVALAAAL